MGKDFKKWHAIKSHVDNLPRAPSFREREVWWVYLGANIGNEQDGQGENFSRPVLVIQKYNRNQLLVVPLSSQVRGQRYRFNFTFKGREQSALLSQLSLEPIETQGSRCRSRTLACGTVARGRA